MKFLKFSLFCFFILYIFGCSEKTTYSGKIIMPDNLSNLNIYNKSELIKKFGNPSFIDEIQNKYFYYTEMKKSSNFYNKSIKYSYLFVFHLDKNDDVIDVKAFDILDNNVTKFKKDITQNNIIERGLIEKIFGGVGPSQLPNSP